MTRMTIAAQYSLTARVATTAMIANRSTPYLPERRVLIIPTNIVRATAAPTTVTRI